MKREQELDTLQNLMSRKLQKVTHITQEITEEM